MTIQSEIDSYDEYVNELMAEHEDKVEENALTLAAILYFLTREQIDELIIRWNALVVAVATLTNEEVNEQLGEVTDTVITQEQIEQHQAVGAFYAVEGVRQGFRRIHSATIALQVTDEEREQAIEDAKKEARNDAVIAATVAILFTYAVMTETEQKGRGVSGYVWRTKRDDRVRPTHRYNEGKYFAWDSPPQSTGHPGHNYGCRCHAEPVVGDAESNREEDSTIMAEVKHVSTRTRPKASGACELKSFSSPQGAFTRNSRAYVDEQNPNKAFLYISGTIGDDWDINTTDWQVVELNGITASTTDIDVFINTPGGSMAHGIAIYNFLRLHPANVRTFNMGDASSAGSIIFLAGSERYMPMGTSALIHDPWDCGCFNRHDLEKLQAYMQFSSERMVDIYSSHLTISRDEIATMMQAQTELGHQQALVIGFSTSDTFPTDTLSADTVAAMRQPPDVHALANTVNAMAIHHLEDRKDDNMTDKTNAEGGVDATALAAKVALLTNDLTASRSELQALKAERDTREDETTMRDRIRAELVTEATELANVKGTLTAMGVETTSTATNPMALMRDVLAEMHVPNAKDASKMPDTAIKSTFDWYASMHTDNSGQVVVNTLLASKSGGDKDGEYNPFAGMKKV